LEGEKENQLFFRVMGTCWSQGIGCGKNTKEKKKDMVTPSIG
jgi:hypothetical protein